MANLKNIHYDTKTQEPGREREQGLEQERERGQGQGLELEQEQERGQGLELEHITYCQILKYTIMQNELQKQPNFILGISLVSIFSAIAGCVIFYAGECTLSGAKEFDQLHSGVFHVVQYEFGQITHDYKTNDVYFEGGDLKIIKDDSIITLQPAAVQEIVFEK